MLDDATVGVLDVNLAARKEADVRVHAEVGADDRFHVDRPAKSGRVNHSLHTGRARPSHLEPDVADVAALGAFDRREDWRRLRRASPSDRAAFPHHGGLPDVLPYGSLLCHVPSLSEQKGRCYHAAIRKVVLEGVADKRQHPAPVHHADPPADGKRSGW